MFFPQARKDFEDSMYLEHSEETIIELSKICLQLKDIQKSGDLLRLGAFVGGGFYLSR